ncbi:DUF4276 family protein [Serratia marcescens]|uniref:DUF4276 family protein n=1 Tax=Serratia marcescens TaxID=615 RepID=A0A5C7CHN1_SERMA|nr:DUF4276 family protein [Serratia marcescens]TXE35332.1 DUF4276 family protein [Serratia marcescens]TXE67934.1 DUF4276 family protein [Serratia marcescens]BEL97155.1 hypothetical protein SM14BL09_43080 [Serratia marcescens]HCR3024978.1 DUF4276 family protein [Serratia marcescens]HEJ7027139.1 DUF4276 family protein [Serratia marcescens]
MNSQNLVLGTEDELSEAIGEKLVSLTNGKLIVNQKLRQNGFGYLKKRIHNFCQLAERHPVLLITDLDNAACPEKLKLSWLKERKEPDSFIFRVAVREIESWILADHSGLNTLFGKKAGKFPDNPDLLPNPKATLLSLAGKAPRDVKEALVAKKGSTAIQGIQYNSLLCDFVKRNWNPEEASLRSKSLALTINSLNKLAENI